MATQSATTIAMMPMTTRAPSRSLLGHLLAVLVQPGSFFTRLPATRHWLLAALLILIVIGTAAVRRPAGEDGAIFEPVPIPDVNAPPMDSGGDFGAVPFDPSVNIPPGALDGGGNPATPDIADTLIVGLLAAGNLLVALAFQTLLLSEVSLFNGRAPQLGRNLQLAVWASVPLGLMALFQVIYYALGGQGGMLGVSLLLQRWEAYGSLPLFVQSFLHSFAVQLTLFWLWNAILLYFAARYGLRGKAWASWVVVVAWLMIATLVPALTGAVQPLAAEVPVAEFGNVDPAVLQPGMDMSVAPSGTTSGGVEPVIELLPGSP
ncbi:MAG: hypothetical protein SF123_23655 [Chloroflexota bacterium]|nr:hypothetical protein [Chloroflexota bacterium]